MITIGDKGQVARHLSYDEALKSARQRKAYGCSQHLPQPTPHQKGWETRRAKRSQQRIAMCAALRGDGGSGF